MSRWPYVFFAAAATYILIGVTWGIYMAISHDFATAPGHAHLNLIGWVSLAIMGGYYALLGQKTPVWLITTNFALSNIGVVAMVLALGLGLSQTIPMDRLHPLFAIGAFATLGGFISFAAAIGRGLRLASSSFSIRRSQPAAA